MPTTYKPTNTDQYSSLALQLTGKSVRLTAAGKATVEEEDQWTSVDFAVPYDCIMNGGMIICEGSVASDGFSISVVDVNGVFGVPPGTSLLTPYEDWAPAPSIQVSVPYPAKLYAGLYIRMSYRNTQMTPVYIVLNLPLHKVLF